MSMNKVFLKRRNWNIDYKYDILNGNGFTITEPSEFQMDKKAMKSIHGTRSPLYGTDFSDEQSFIERYHCECGAIKGAQFEHEICPICNTPVEFTDVNIEFTGWLTLGDKYIISPYYYQLLASVIGKPVLEDMIIVKKKVDRDGNVTDAAADDLAEKPRSPFSRIGASEFRRRYDEVMQYFRNKKKKMLNKVSAIDHLIDEKDKVFVSKIPVYSTFLRPQSQTADTLFFNQIDKQIEPLYNLTEKLKDATDIDEYFILSRIQTRVNKLWDINFKLINGKEGFIRDQILGGGLNYVTRNVVVPDMWLRADEVTISYHAFRILFKDKILRYLMLTCGMTLSAAMQKWNEGHVFDPQIYEVMQTIVYKEQSAILLNRNPTLNFYSMLLMHIKNISKDPDNFTLGIPFFILPGLNADFDGDILNAIAMMNKAIEHAFRKFKPIEYMQVSRDSGKFNEYFSVPTNQMVDLHYFCVL